MKNLRKFRKEKERDMRNHIEIHCLQTIVSYELFQSGDYFFFCNIKVVGLFRFFDWLEMGLD